METLLETIRTAVHDSATPAQKQAGAAACRALLTAIEGQPGHLLTAPAPAASRPGVDQILDLVIARLRTMMPNQAPASPARLSFPLVTAPGAAP